MVPFLLVPRRINHFISQSAVTPTSKMPLSPCVLTEVSEDSRPSPLPYLLFASRE